MMKVTDALSAGEPSWGVSSTVTVTDTLMDDVPLKVRVFAVVSKVNVSHGGRGLPSACVTLYVRGSPSRSVNASTSPARTTWSETAGTVGRRLVHKVRPALFRNAGGTPSSLSPTQSVAWRCNKTRLAKG